MERHRRVAADLAARADVLATDAVPADAAPSGRPEVELTVRPGYDTVPDGLLAAIADCPLSLDVARDRGEPPHKQLVLR